jgi:hypothetical protein
VVEAAFARDFRDVHSARRAGQFAPGLVQTRASQVFERGAPEKAPEVLFQRASRQAGKSRELTDLPGISQVTLEEIDGFLHIARKQTSEHRGDSERQPSSHCGRAHIDLRLTARLEAQIG